MGFRITRPYSIVTHVKKFTSVTSLINKTKAGAIGMISGVLMYNNGTSVIPIAGSGVTAPSGGAARTLTAADSGSTNLFDAATSISYTLPAPVVGLTFHFLWTALETGGQVHQVVTNAGTVFINGVVQMFSGEAVTPSATLGPFQFAGNGTSFVRFASNGTTTGGGIGSWLTLRCTATTLWTSTGNIKSPSGNLATPFAV